MNEENLQKGDEKKNFRSNPLLNSVRHRLHRLNQNWICLVHGKVGSGKSYSGLTICKYIDSNFGIDQVCFSAKELIELVRSGKLGRGSAILLDEAGISMGSRDFQSKENKQLSALFQTFRSLNYALVITVPNLAFIDKQARQILHCLAETISIDRKKQVCKVKWKNVSLHWKTNEPIGKYSWIRSETGFASRVKHLNISKPPSDLVTKYEARKKIYLKELIDDLAEKLSPSEPKDKPIKPVNRACLDCGNRWFSRSVSEKPCCSMCKKSRTISIVGSK